MADILEFVDVHQAVERLLPWYSTGQIDDADRTLVRTHIASCAECRASLAFDHELKTVVLAMSPQAEADWSALRERLAASSATSVTICAPAVMTGGRREPASAQGLPAHRRSARASTARLVRSFALPALAASAAAALVIAVMPTPTPTPPTAYRTLGSVSGPRIGNLIVMFRPDASEAELRGALHGSGARLVDGPTAANAYIVEVPQSRRPTALEALRARPAVTMAEPIDAAPAR